jgi:cobalt-zinc-cadmium efflux system outer membrane protein
MFARNGSPSTTDIAPLVAMVCTLAWAMPLRAADVREPDVVQIVRERDPAIAQAEAEREAARAQRVGAGLYPNPTVQWQREHFVGLQSEDAVGVSIPLQFSGQRRSQKAVAEAGVLQSEAAIAMARNEAVRRGLALFYEVIAARSGIEVEETISERLTEASRIVGRRQAEGTASGYEHARLLVELELARSQLSERVGRFERLHGSLAVVLGIPPADLEVVGTLVPSSSPGLRPEPPSERTSTNLLREATTSASRARRAARWGWVPRFDVLGGVRVLDTGPANVGYTAGLTMTMPVFTRGQQLKAWAQASVESSRSRTRAQEQSIAVAVAEAQAGFEAASMELERFEAAVAEPIERLERSALSGYREGERTIIELVDAQRTRAAVERRKIELALAMRIAQVTLRAARGEFE